HEGVAGFDRFVRAGGSQHRLPGGGGQAGVQGQDGIALVPRPAQGIDEVVGSHRLEHHQPVHVETIGAWQTRAVMAPGANPSTEGWRAWVAGARPRTLPAAVVPVLVGTACAAGEVDVIAWRAIAAGVVALALQIGTNYANDYSDGVRGTDDPGLRVGPVRLVGWGIKRPSAVKKAALLSFLTAGVAGSALAVAVGPELI